MPETPVKLCECGCGQPAPISKYNDKRRGIRKGEPCRFIRGHSAKVGEHRDNLMAAKRRENARREEEARPRREQVRALYLEGRTLEEIEDAVGLPRGTAQVDLRIMRERGVKLPYRARPSKQYVDDSLAEAVEAAWSEQHLTVPQIAEQFGWSRRQAATVVAALRRAGFAIDRRLGHPVQLSDVERSQVARDFKKRQRVPGDLSPDRQIILRLLQAAKRPVAAMELHAFLRGVKRPLPKVVVHRRLFWMRKAELISSVEVPQTRWFERGIRWFVPLGAELSVESLTLADAERETELAALIESQKDELQRGDWRPRSSCGRSRGRSGDPNGPDGDRARPQAR